MKKNLLTIILSVVCGLSIVCSVVSLSVGLSHINDTTINEKVEVIESTLDELEALDTTLDGNIKALETKVSTLESELEETNTAIETLEEDVSSLQEAKEALEADITSIKADIESLKAKDTELEGKITALETTLNSSVEDVKEWVKTNYVTIESCEDLEEEIRGLINSLDSRVTALETSVNTLNGAAETLKEQVNQNKEEIEELENRINCLEGNHEWSYTVNDDGTHTKVCSVCGYSDNEDHTFDITTGKCSVCKAEIAVASVTIDGTTTYYETLYEAADVAQNGTKDTPATLKMEQDIDLGNNRLETSFGVFTFDLNGKTLSGSKDSWGTFSSSGGNVTIIDSGEGGTITNSTYHGVQAYGCTLTIEGGIFTGYYVGVDCSESTVIINGGTFIGSNEYGVRADTSTVTINGGTFTGTKYDLYNYDFTITLGLGKDGVGATFPDGLAMFDDNGNYQPAGLALKDILGAGAAYWQGDKMIILTEGQTQITGGDVIIKAE